MFNFGLNLTTTNVSGLITLVHDVNPKVPCIVKSKAPLQATCGAALCF